MTDEELLAELEARTRDVLKRDGRMYRLEDHPHNGSTMEIQDGWAHEGRWEEWHAAVRLRDVLRTKLELKAQLSVRYEMVAKDAPWVMIGHRDSFKYEHWIPGPPEYFVNNRSVAKAEFERIRELQRQAYIDKHGEPKKENVDE